MWPWSESSGQEGREPLHARGGRAAASVAFDIYSGSGSRHVRRFSFFFFCSHKTKPSAFPDPGKRLPVVASPRTHHHVRCCLSSSRRFKQETDEFARPDVVSILKGGWFNKAGARDPQRVHKALPVAVRGTGEPHPWGGVLQT